MTATPQQQAANILIVDDTPANLLLLVRMLAERGYTPRTVLSGKLALEAARHPRGAPSRVRPHGRKSSHRIMSLQMK